MRIYTIDYVDSEGGDSLRIWSGTYAEARKARREILENDPEAEIYSLDIHFLPSPVNRKALVKLLNRVADTH